MEIITKAMLKYKYIYTMYILQFIAFIWIVLFYGIMTIRFHQAV